MRLKGSALSGSANFTWFPQRSTQLCHASAARPPSWQVGLVQTLQVWLGEAGLPGVGGQVLVVLCDFRAAGVAKTGRICMVLQTPDCTRVLVWHLPAPLVQLL